MMPAIKGAKFLKELKEFDNLVKAIGECKSKAEEDRIIGNELELLKQRLSDPKLDKSRGREYMVRLLYCEMLGHDVSWAYIKALQFASESNILSKKAAYLCLTQFFDHNHELVLLLVNTLLSDLKNDNFIIVCTALSVATRLIGPDLISAVMPLVLDRLKHPKEHVRKKAVIVLQRFSQLDPLRDGPLSGNDLDKHFRTMLCDKDPSVMSATLCSLYHLVKTDPRPYKNLIPSFTSILKQVSEHRLPKSYDYHRFPAPFIQIRLLKTLAVLGEGDRAASENMYAVVHQTLRRANTTHTIGNALIYECVRTITTLFPHASLLAAAAESIATFLKSSSHNLKYVGIDALAGIVKINASYAQEHQLAVLDCLEDPDDTLKLKTLELLYKMTKGNNVTVIVEKMMSYLRATADEHIRRDIARKVSELAERYAPSPQWFITVMTEVFELGGDHVESQLAHNLMRLVAEQDETLQESAATSYVGILSKTKLPDVLLQVVVWVLGEYGTLAVAPDGSRMTAPQIMDSLAAIPATHKASDTVRGMVLSAIAKLASQGGFQLTPAAMELVRTASSSRNTDLQQRAYEVQALCRATRSLQTSVLPHDSANEVFDESDMAAIRNLSFMDDFVQKALMSGASMYLNEDERDALVVNGNGADKGGHLRFEAYDAPVAPVPTSASQHTSSSGRAGSFSGAQRHGELIDLSGGIAGPAFAGVPPAAAPAAAPATPHQPQLIVRSQGPRNPGRRWGPAEAAPPEPPRPNPGGPMPRLEYSIGEPFSPSQPHSAPSPVAPPPQPPKPLTEREKLAASIFGGGTGPSNPPAAAAQPSWQRAPAAAAPSTSAYRPTPEIGHSRSAGALPATGTGRVPTPHHSPAPSQASDFDLLMDLNDALPPPSAGHGQLAPGHVRFGSGGAGAGAQLASDPLASLGMLEAALPSVMHSHTNAAMTGPSGQGFMQASTPYPQMPPLNTPGPVSLPGGVVLSMNSNATSQQYGAPASTYPMGGAYNQGMPPSVAGGSGAPFAVPPPWPGMGAPQQGMRMNMPPPQFPSSAATASPQLPMQNLYGQPQQQPQQQQPQQQQQQQYMRPGQPTGPPARAPAPSNQSDSLIDLLG